MRDKRASQTTRPDSRQSNQERTVRAQIPSGGNVTKLHLTCGRCYHDVKVHVETAVLRVNTVPEAMCELLFRCPTCNEPEVQLLGPRTLAVLLQVGIEPIALGEPSLDAGDMAPAGPPFQWDDLLDWHRQLSTTFSVDPWT